MKSMFVAVASLLIAAGPALAGESIPVPEPSGLGAAAGVVLALLALKGLRK